MGWFIRAFAVSMGILVVVVFGLGGAIDLAGGQPVTGLVYLVIGAGILTVMLLLVQRRVASKVVAD